MVNGDVWSSRWNENWKGKPKYSEKTCPSATLFTTNPTWPDLGSNPGRRGGKPATNHLSYGTAFVYVSVHSNKHFLPETCSMEFVSVMNGFFFCISDTVSHCVNV
jgi:hypothetical protein